MSRKLSSVPVLGTLVDVVRSSFQRKLITALFLVFLIASAGAVGLYVQVGGLLEDNVKQSMTAAAETEASELEEWENKNRIIAQLLSEHPVYETGDHAEIQEYLQAQCENRPFTKIVRAYVIDRRNQTVATSTHPVMEGTTIGNLSWDERFAFRSFEDVQMTEPYAVSNGTTVVGFISPIHRMPEQLFVVEVDTASIFDRFDHPVDNGFTRVVNSNGTVVVSDDTGVTLTQYREGERRAPEVSSGLRGNSGFTESPAYENRPETEGEYVAAYAAVPNTDWVVVEYAPAGEAYVIAQQGLQWIIGIGVFTMIGFVSIVSILGRDVRGALSNLTDRAREVKNGRYDVDFDTDRPDEFGDLNRTLASTQDTLQQRIEEIRETRDELEASNTALEERSEMVDVLNRILRHNVRNEVNVIVGRAELAASRIDDTEAQEHLDVIQEAAWNLSTIAKRTQHIKQLVANGEAETESLRIHESVASELMDVESDIAGTTLEFVGEENEPVVEATHMLPTAIADVVEQITTHNDGAVNVTVSITTENAASDGEMVVLRIDDDANGLPISDIEAVKAGEESPLNHAKGLALWCLEWTVENSNGDLQADPDDATVKIRLPTASSQ